MLSLSSPPPSIRASSAITPPPPSIRAPSPAPGVSPHSNRYPHPSIFSWNQYTNIVSEAEFIPEFDGDGNQTKVKTSTGIWHITYNGENRPVVWTNTTGIVVEMDYDHMGRRIHKKVSDNNGVQSDLQFIYDGYLQVVSMATNAVTTTFWDPTESIATRPLAMQNGGTVYTYTHDLTKNVMELLDDSGAPVVVYDYDAFGSMTASAPFANCFGFSSEYFDSDLGCVYYNYRHYNPADGRWVSRDRIEEIGGMNLYRFCSNCGLKRSDFLGKISVGPFTPPCCSGSECYQWIQNRRNNRILIGEGLCSVGAITACYFSGPGYFACVALIMGKCSASVVLSAAAAFAVGVPICEMCTLP